MFYYTLNTINQPPSLKVKTNYPLIYSPLYWRSPIPMALSLLSFLPPPPPSTRTLSSANAVSPAPSPALSIRQPTPPRRPLMDGRDHPLPAQGEPSPPGEPDRTRLPSQGQYATLYLAHPLHELQLCSALSPGSLARLACALSLSWLARAVELETLAIPPRETLTLALAPPREAAGEPGSRRAADPDPDAVAPSRADRGRSRPNPAGIRGVSPRVRVCTVVNRAGGGSPGGVRDVIGFGDFF